MYRTSVDELFANDVHPCTSLAKWNPSKILICIKGKLINFIGRYVRVYLQSLAYTSRYIFWCVIAFQADEVVGQFPTKMLFFFLVSRYLTAQLGSFSYLMFNFLNYLYFWSSSSSVFISLRISKDSEYFRITQFRWSNLRLELFKKDRNLYKYFY